jgi:iron complex outermembrane receptor protein
MAGRALILSAFGMASQVCAADDDRLASLSLEQLGDVMITSVSRQEERLSNAAASIFIISSNDIARSGARSLPEALRLAPNLEVARVDARNYAISARGFNSAFANKLLVLIDGRSVYSPLFSGVFWDAQDVLMSDIQRIEVISGPGATIYGANAVNGVINIITKSAKDTQGGFAAATVGEHDQAGGFRYGGVLPNGGHYRAYAKSVSADDTLTASGANTETGFRRTQAGFRSDWDFGLTGVALSGDVYEGRLGQLGTRDIRTGGANLNGEVNWTLDDGSELRTRLVLDHTERNQPLAFAERLDTVDLQVQHNVTVAGSHRIAWGGGYRQSNDRIDGSTAFTFLPGEFDMHWASLFVQDEVALAGPLKATVGLKAEHNNYTGLEYLPNLRLAYSTARAGLIWASLSRTVRAPSRTDHDLYAPGQPAVVNGAPVYALAGGPNFQSEVAKVLELGYRAQVNGTFSYSVTTFYGAYDRLRTLEPKSDGAVFENLGEGHTRGVEAWWRWQPLDTWRLSGGVVVQHIGTRLLDISRDPTGVPGPASNDPARHALLRSSLDLSETQQLDLSLRYSAALPAPAVPAYVELDAQWSWNARPGLDVLLIGQNLLHSSHAEFGGAQGRSVFERGVLLKLVQRF